MSLTSAADRVPPYNLEAERSVLGACLLDKDALAVVMESLQTEDFYDPRHRSAQPCEDCGDFFTLKITRMREKRIRNPFAVGEEV